MGEEEGYQTEPEHTAGERQAAVGVDQAAEQEADFPGWEEAGAPEVADKALVKKKQEVEGENKM